ncbi:hypothetical protein NLU13_5936 [Sarocladium strictum]|uniref:Uncharacterized protein n=1 Tax=Sarocladium strictum TaxID=5046 RepID=A0AA39GFP3_SARSR|nr:hypothetical protein NLU13_5936 [Sarocladium strictum]
MPTACTHQVLYCDTSEDASKNTSWNRPDENARLAAKTLNGLPPSARPDDVPKPSSFPGPLVMPDDALAIDPDQEPQGLHEYVNADYRNRVTPQRKTIYVFDAPDVAPGIAHARTWQDPVIPPGPENQPPAEALGVQKPVVQDLAAYIEAFYHGMTVRVVENRFRLVEWHSQNRATGSEIGLEALDSSGSPSTITQIRCRPSPDGVAPKNQLNLNDLLDGLQEALPSDAYAAILLMHHDLYEDDEDDFCCGRAYGASRICVISTFRYHPKLGPFEGIIPEHTWPNSHCRDYVDNVWACSADDASEESSNRRRTFDPSRMIKVPSSKTPRSLAPLAAAVSSVRSLSPQNFERGDWEATWLARACVVAVHELGHCFGLDHCVYYACVMQGTASVAEDTQQPPYLCPVCQAKVAYTAAVEAKPTAGRRRRTMKEVERMERAWTLKQYTALQEFCEERTAGVMFKALGPWLRSRVLELEGDNG